jgi:uncharacterized protein YdaU (DUF1376 family)
MKWYKRDPDAALAGMAELTFEERGAYNSLIDLLYSRDGDVPDDDAFCARVFHCRPQVWRRLKLALMAMGKVRDLNGKLTANRVETELQTAHKLMENMGYLGRLSAEKRKQTNEILQRFRSTAAEDTTTTRKKASLNGKVQRPDQVTREELAAIFAAKEPRPCDTPPTTSETADQPTAHPQPAATPDHPPAKTTTPSPPPTDDQPDPSKLPHPPPELPKPPITVEGRPEKRPDQVTLAELNQRMGWTPPPRRGPFT